MIEGAARALGGMERLIAWIGEAPENEFVFWSSMYMKLMPVQLRTAGEVEVTVEKKLTIEQLREKLVERGLPPFVFGDDAPVLVPELEPPTDCA